MQTQPPRTLYINHDKHHAKHVGRTADGRQFFLTTPFVPGHPLILFITAFAPRFLFPFLSGREFLALYLFDADGQLLEAIIDDLGSRAWLDVERARRLREERLAQLGDVEFGRIQVAPFRLQRFGVTFGLIPDPPEEEGDHWWVTLEPGNYMAFFPPWDGRYDT